MCVCVLIRLVSSARWDITVQNKSLNFLPGMFHQHTENIYAPIVWAFSRSRSQVVLSSSLRKRPVGRMVYCFLPHQGVFSYRHGVGLQKGGYTFTAGG